MYVCIVKKFSNSKKIVQNSFLFCNYTNFGQYKRTLVSFTEFPKISNRYLFSSGREL